MGMRLASAVVESFSFTKEGIDYVFGEFADHGVIAYATDGDLFGFVITARDGVEYRRWRWDDPRWKDVLLRANQ